jgi:ribulose-phosphate 3-epimerase
MRVKIAPSMAAADQSRLGWAVRKAQEWGADLIHLDLEDGVFIPNLTFGPRTIRDLRPHSDLPFDVHMEVHDPERYLAEVVQAGADVVTVQVEATHYPFRILHILKGAGVRAGLALTAATPLEVLQPVVDELDVIHLMTAEPNGVGAGFIPALVEKVRAARALVGGRPVEIEVDGGIGVDAAAALVEAGATVLVVGRAIWGTDDPAGAIRRLRGATEGRHAR